MSISMLSSLSTKQKWVYFSTGLVGSIICQLLFSRVGSNMTEIGYTILDLEFAWTAESLDLILGAWEPIRDEVIRYMIIDMFFPIFYFLTLNGWSLLINHKESCLKVVTTVAILASTFDYIENIFTFVVLYNPDDYISIAPLAISVFAILKFLLIAFVIVRNLVKMIFKK